MSFSIGDKVVSNAYGNGKVVSIVGTNQIGVPDSKGGDLVGANSYYPVCVLFDDYVSNVTIPIDGENITFSTFYTTEGKSGGTDFITLAE